MFRSTPVLRFQATKPVFATPTLSTKQKLPGFALRAAVVNAVKDKFSVTDPSRPPNRPSGTMSAARLKYITDFAKLYNKGKIIIPLSKNTLDQVDLACLDISLFERDGGEFASPSAKQEVAEFKRNLMERIKEDLPHYTAPQLASRVPLDDDAADVWNRMHDKEDFIAFIERRNAEEVKEPAVDMIEFEKRNLLAKWDKVIEPAHQKSFRNMYEEYYRDGYTIAEVNQLEEKAIPEPPTNKSPQVFVHVPKDLHVQKMREVRQKNNFSDYGLPNLTAPERQLEAEFVPKEVNLEAEVEQDLERQRREAATPEGKSKREAVQKLLLSKLSEKSKQLFQTIFPKGMENEASLSPSELQVFRRFKQKFVNLQNDLYPPTPKIWSPFHVNFDVDKLLLGRWELTRLSRDPAFAPYQEKFLQLAAQAQQEYNEFTENAIPKVSIGMLINPAQNELAKTDVKK